MTDLQNAVREIAQHMRARREAVLHAWRAAVKRDPEVTSGDSLPRTQLFDHIPAMLATFERELSRGPIASAISAEAAAQEPAAAHGLQRWQQGYDLREVTRELGKLNECVVDELEAYAQSNSQATPAGIAAARKCWAAICSTAIEESVSQYFLLQQQEASGHVTDLENALAEIRELEQQRADIWRQAAHDLRGNLGVVANATVGLTYTGLKEDSRDEFVRILMRNVTSLHHLLDDVTSLARLEAGAERRRIEVLDVTTIMLQLCEGIRPLAQQRRLFLRSDGPPGFGVEGDSIKIRRIAQNLMLNAVKYTQAGGITVSWGDSGPTDPKRWMLTIADTGPGFQSESGQPIAHALINASEAAVLEPGVGLGTAGDHPAATAGPSPNDPAPLSSARFAARDGGGEGIGLSIVKRLCELLDATVQMESAAEVGTTFRILFPRHYSD
jgi:signal transduction histidine kinase